MVDIVQQVSTDIVLSDKSEAEAGTNNTKFMTPLRTKEAIDKNTSNLLPNTSIVQVEGNATDKVMSQAATTASITNTKTELTNQIGAAVLPFNAMSQSQFEAIRAANNEEFAASGFVHFGKHDANNLAGKINEGLWSAVAPDTVNTLLYGRTQLGGGVGASKTYEPVVNIAGVAFSLLSIDGYKGVIKFPQAPDGKTTYNKSTGAIVTHVDSTTAFAAQQADPTNVEVVIDRVDMWGFEAWLEEVNSTNPFVYPNGLIQSQATTMDGIPTSASARPVTYYAVFDGDTGSKGKGVNFFTLTDAQKKKVLGNHKNNLYYLDDGRLVQWRLRQRTIAGAGNGDWSNVSGILNTSANYPMLSFGSLIAKAHPQGIKNVAEPLSNDESVHGVFGGRRYASEVWDKENTTGDYSIFQASASSLPSTTVGRECYFLVCGTVNRLNQGGYHPSFNPSGAGKYLDGNDWFNTSRVVQSTSSTFSEALFGGIGSHSGRPDGRFYDAIYADGFGGVCRDMRYSANGLTPTDFADADQRVKNGTYRGFEKAVFTKVIQGSSQGQAEAFGLYYHDNLPIEGIFAIFKDAGFSSQISVGDIQYIYQKSDGLLLAGVVTRVLANSIDCRRLGGDVAIRSYSQQSSANFIWISSASKPSSIGGSFLQTDVIGSPSNILATPQLANGWQGSWIPVIPDGTSKKFGWTRKNLDTSGAIQVVYTGDNGASWSTANPAFNPVTNGRDNVSLPAVEVGIYQYQAFAKQTKPSANAVVYGGLHGVGDIYAVNGYAARDWSVLLGESLTGLIGKSTANNTLRNLLPLSDVGFEMSNSKLRSDIFNTTKHAPLTLSAPANNSPAFKALNYNVATNQQGFINYAYTELKHNGTNWGDDGKVTIVDNQSTKTDLNGSTVLVGTAQLNEPLGWIKNKV